MTEPTHARYSRGRKVRFSAELQARGWPAELPSVSDARVAVLDQLAQAYERHSRAEEDARDHGKHEAADEHHDAILLLTGMCKEAERR